MMLAKGIAHKYKSQSTWLKSSDPVFATTCLLLSRLCPASRPASSTLDHCSALVLESTLLLLQGGTFGSAPRDVHHLVASSMYSSGIRQVAKQYSGALETLAMTCLHIEAYLETPESPAADRSDSLALWVFPETVEAWAAVSQSHAGIVDDEHTGPEADKRAAAGLAACTTVCIAAGVEKRRYWGVVG